MLIRVGWVLPGRRHSQNKGFTAEVSDLLGKKIKEEVGIISDKGREVREASHRSLQTVVRHLLLI